MTDEICIVLTKKDLDKVLFCISFVKASEKNNENYVYSDGSDIDRKEDLQNLILKIKEQKNGNGRIDTSRDFD